MPVLHTVSANANFNYKAVLPSPASCPHWNTINSINTAYDIKSRWNSDQWVSWLILCLHHVVPFFAKTNWFIRLCLFLVLPFFFNGKRDKFWLTTGHFGIGILLQMCIQDSITDLVTNLVCGHITGKNIRFRRFFTNALKKTTYCILNCTLSLTLIIEDVNFVIYMKVWKVTS